MERTLKPLLKAPQSFNILTKSSFSKPLPRNKVNAFFVIEGCHSLVDSVNEVKDGKVFPPDEILANLDILLKQVSVFAINLTHLQQSNLCNHAMGIQLTKTDPF